MNATWLAHKKSEEFLGIYNQTWGATQGENMNHCGSWP